MSVPVSEFLAIHPDRRLDFDHLGLAPASAVTATLDGSVYLVAVSGVLSKAYYSSTVAEVAKAFGSSAVDAIALEIDSPGGTIHGAIEAAERLRSMRGPKPLVAMVHGDALGSAYALAAACDRVLVSRTAAVGGIGILARHVETSKQDEALGITITPVFAGEQKNDGSAFEPLSSAARERIQAEVDRLRLLLAENVAASRGRSLEAILRTEAAIYYADNAVRTGLADEVTTSRRALDRMQSAARERRALLAAQRAAVEAAGHETRNLLARSRAAGCYTETRRALEAGDMEQARSIVGKAEHPAPSFDALASLFHERLRGAGNRP